MAAFHERLAHLRSVVEFERFEAIDGGNLDLEAMLQRVSPHNRDIGSETYMRGAIGCSLSHVTLWERIGRRSDGPVLIFEDDALPLRDVSASEFDAIIEAAPADLDVLWLNDDMYPRTNGRLRWVQRSLLRRLPSGPVAAPRNEWARNLHRSWRYWRWPARAFKTNEAYLVSPACARRLAADIANDLVKIDIRVREVIRGSGMRGYELKEPLFTQADRSDTYGTFGR